jgi:hypothetical protein
LLSRGSVLTPQDDNVVVADCGRSMGAQHGADDDGRMRYGLNNCKRKLIKQLQ